MRRYRKYQAQTRSHPCPTCRRPERLTDRDRARGYQCDDCTRRDAAAYGDGFNDTGY